MKPERRVYEVERDRFGVTFSGPLEVGECIRVVSLDAVVEALRAKAHCIGPELRDAIGVHAAANWLEREFGGDDR